MCRVDINVEESSTLNVKSLVAVVDELLWVSSKRNGEF